jgi:hypothetical protein
MKSRNALAVAPLALGLIHQGLRPSTTAPPQETVPAPAAVSTRSKAAKQFSIPVTSLRDWAKSVVVTLDNVTVEGNGPLHKLEDDCEIHFGAHTPSFSGEPDGLVLEPMNACIFEPPEGFASWPAFAKSLKGKPMAASGVPRIWPEHLEGGGPSNPDHAVELHPLTAVATSGGTFDFAPQVSAGEYHGKDGNRSIVGRVAVSLTASGGTAAISFRGGQVGNFTTLDLLINRASITKDDAGSYRMDGEVPLDDSTTVPVRIVTVAGSDVNKSMPGIKKRSGATHTMEGALVLYSLSPEALLDAATKSHGQEVTVDRPIQLILYGTPDTE